MLENFDAAHVQMVTVSSAENLRDGHDLRELKTVKYNLHAPHLETVQHI